MADADVPPPSILEGAALFLDFDGTLVELAESPQAINVPGGLVPLLDRLAHRLDGRLAIVSGRAIADLDRHLRYSGIAVSGSHGLELRLANGQKLPTATPDTLAEARAEILRFAAQTPGIIVEDKPHSLAVHFRQAPEQERNVAALLAKLATQTGLTIQDGKMVVEIRPGGADKGDALRALMTEPGFVGARPVFVGDDLTDENAFAAAAAMGGAGVLVGPARPSAAKWRIPDVRSVALWLDQATGGAG